MTTYTTEQLLSSNLSTEFYSADTIDVMIGNLSSEEAAAILDKISSDINPKLSDIADAVSSHIKETSRFIDKSEDSLEEISENISTLSARVANTYTKSEINDKNKEDSSCRCCGHHCRFACLCRCFRRLAGQGQLHGL